MYAIHWLKLELRKTFDLLIRKSMNVYSICFLSLSCSTWMEQIIRNSVDENSKCHMVLYMRSYILNSFFFFSVSSTIIIILWRKLNMLAKITCELVYMAFVSGNIWNEWFLYVRFNTVNFPCHRYRKLILHSDMEFITTYWLWYLWLLSSLSQHCALVVFFHLLKFIWWCCLS